MFFSFFKLIIMTKSSAYAVKLISLYKAIMLASLLYAIRKRITDSGDPCGMPLVNGRVLDVCDPIRTCIFLFRMKF